MKYWDDEPVTSCTSIAYAPNAKAESSCSPTRMTSPPGLNLSHQALSSQLNGEPASALSVAAHLLTARLSHVLEQLRQARAALRLAGDGSRV
jgi:hypothetical protein